MYGLPETDARSCYSGRQSSTCYWKLTEIELLCKLSYSFSFRIAKAIASGGEQALAAWNWPRARTCGPFVTLYLG
jgi:hypothetical protein